MKKWIDIHDLEYAEFGYMPREEVDFFLRSDSLAEFARKFATRPCMAMELMACLNEYQFDCAIRFLPFLMREETLDLEDKDELLESLAFYAELKGLNQTRDWIREFLSDEAK